jgi:hypothetical protein
MKRWQWALLVFDLALVAIILILPQVDLPEFTFHGGSAPVALHSRVHAAPVRAVAAVSATVFYLHESHAARSESGFNLPQGPDHRLSLLCTPLC